MVGQAELAAVLDAARNAYEAIVIDTGPLFDAAMLAALDHTDQLLLVCNPEVTSLKNVRIGLETIDRLGFERDRVSLVANRLGAAGGVRRDDIEHALDTKSRTSCPTTRLFRPPSTGVARRSRRREEQVRACARRSGFRRLRGSAGPMAPAQPKRRFCGADDERASTATDSRRAADASVLAERLQVDRGSCGARARSARRAEDEDPPDVHRPARRAFLNLEGTDELGAACARSSSRS